MDFAFFKSAFDLWLTTQRIMFSMSPEEAIFAMATVQIASLSDLVADRLGLDTAQNMLSDATLDVTERALESQAAA